MKRLLFMILLVFCFHTINAEAANWYVRPSGGSGSGTSWTAAWNEMNGINWGSVSCGDTIWIAGGSYAQALTIPTKNCSSSAPLAIRRARSDSSACTSAAGWSSGYDSTVIQNPTGATAITFPSTGSYITVSGRTTSSGGTYGWQANMPSSTTVGSLVMFARNSTSGATSYYTLEYMDLEGVSNPSVASPDDICGIDDRLSNYPSVSYHTYSHIKLWGFSTGIQTGQQSHTLIEYIDMSNIYANSTVHPDLIFIRYNTYGTIRYSKFHNSCANGSGIYTWSSGNEHHWDIYGNIFYDMTSNGTCFAYKSDSEAPNSYIRIFNNTFENVDGSDITFSNSCNNCEVRNNIIGDGASLSNATVSNNLNSPSTSIYQNYAGKDFHIVSTVGSGYPRNAGINESSVFTTDMDGNTFGADGAWDIGAYEYGLVGSGSTRPDPPVISIM